MGKRFYLLDLRHRGDRLLFWKPNRSGYTENIAEAGIYTEDEIRKELRYFSNDKTCPVPVEKVEKCVKPVVFREHYDALEALRGFENTGPY